MNGLVNLTDGARGERAFCGACGGSENYCTCRKNNGV